MCCFLVVVWVFIRQVFGVGFLVFWLSCFWVAQNFRKSRFLGNRGFSGNLKKS